MPLGWPAWPAFALALASIGAGIVALAAAVAVTRRRMAVVAVDGESMSPAFHSGDRVLVARRGAGRAATAPAVGDVVVFRLPGGPPRSTLIKRVVAVAGDPVPPDVLAAVGAAPGARVPQGSLVVFGDAAESTDSRRWGYLPAGDVIGVVVRPLGRRPAAGEGAARSSPSAGSRAQA